ncbi:MAG: folate-binding protein YgfZ [Legionellales bacterium]|nr:folate-binding protein YgfZ [Legionellales bacterium]
MKPLQYLINSRTLSAIEPLDKELSIPSQKNVFFDLSYLGVIKVQGVRAHEFLQGLLSCDVKGVNHQNIAQGAQCQLQGRVLALMDIIQLDDESLYLILPKDLLHLTMDSLTKTALLSRVTLSDISPFKILGLYHQNPNEALPFKLKPNPTRLSMVSSEGCWCYHIGASLYVLVLDTEASHEVSVSRGSLAWLALKLQHGGIEIYPETRGVFLPQRLGLETSHYVSFNKGCYKGQEIIARMHYRSKPKHTMRLFTVQTEEPLYSGLRLFEPNTGNEIGELIDYCPYLQGTTLIAASILSNVPATCRVEGHTAAISLTSIPQYKSGPPHES